VRHLLVSFASRFPISGAVEFADVVNAEFPDSPRDSRPLIANNDFASVFVAAQFALDNDVSTFSEGAGEFSQSAEGDASMPFGRPFPTFPRRSSRRFWSRAKTLRCLSRC
jgi:hypothetical protein